MVELPLSCYEAWRWFTKLHSRRTAGGFSANPLQYSDIKALLDMYGVTPELWELELIERWDDAALEQMHDQTKQASKTKPKK